MKTTKLTAVRIISRQLTERLLILVGNGIVGW